MSSVASQTEDLCIDAHLTQMLQCMQFGSTMCASQAAETSWNDGIVDVGCVCLSGCTSLAFLESRPLASVVYDFHVQRNKAIARAHQLKANNVNFPSQGVFPSLNFIRVTSGRPRELRTELLQRSAAAPKSCKPKPQSEKCADKSYSYSMPPVMQCEAPPSSGLVIC